jgi:hypothetical protein
MRAVPLEKRAIVFGSFSLDMGFIARIAAPLDIKRCV